MIGRGLILHVLEYCEIEASAKRLPRAFEHHKTASGRSGVFEGCD
jgi:hypothetical protein